jgi:hypothetical protein
MNDFKRVQESNSDDYLLSNLGSIILGKKLLHFDELKEIFAVDEFGDNINVSLGLDALFEFEQQWVRYDLHNATLVPR